MILRESKRDNLLLPYLEMVNSRLKNKMTLGQFKTRILDHLVRHGNIRNLSLASNYYLAGAVRYYFNGDLTNDENLAFFYPYHTEQEIEAASQEGKKLPKNKEDNWNAENCQKLNILIKILRDSYIGSIGTVFEQPEDFGVMPIDKLLKKYGKKISPYIGDNSISTNESNKVGNGYTFEILYNFEQAKKYYEPTSPGSWCITYGQNHYDNYVEDLGIHYVIFRKNGWQRVKRIPQRSKWIDDKPQDTYGNSLIALLQSNRNGEPVYITSRWNHGGEDIGRVEADHAYTKSEFMRITGVTDEELKRIFSIWHKNVGDGNVLKSPTEIKKEALLFFKEAQIRLNGGENILNMFSEHIEVISGNEKDLRNCVLRIYGVKLNRNTYSILLDKNKFIFDTLTDSRLIVTNVNTDPNGKYRLKDVAVLEYKEKYYMIYLLRYHRLLDIDGIKKFKAIPEWGSIDRNNAVFYEVKLTSTKKALVFVNTNTPLRLPNGECWFYSYLRQNDDYPNYGRRLRAGRVCGDYLQISTSSSVLTSYFYSIKDNKFFKLPPLETEEKGDFIPRITRDYEDGYTKLLYSNDVNLCVSWWNQNEFLYALMKDGKIVTINTPSGPQTFFKNIGLQGGGFAFIDEIKNNTDFAYLYDLSEGTPVYFNGKLLFGECYRQSKNAGTILISNNRSKAIWKIFDTKTKKVLENPTNQPSNFEFHVCSDPQLDTDGVVRFTFFDNDFDWDLYWNGNGTYDDRQNYKKEHLFRGIIKNGEVSVERLLIDDTSSGIYESTYENVESSVNNIINELLYK